jgi:acetolactate synthase I/II/III large subunit
MPEPASRIADLMVRCLENEGVTHVFGIPGEENIHLVEALSRSSIRYVLVRHEQGASFMAETFGRLTGRAGVCSATLGPGAINLLLGTADATTNSTPLIALSAQVGMDRSFKESHQGVDLVGMFAPVTKWSALIATPGAVPEMFRKAFKLAQTERPGAVYLAVPEDVEKAVSPAGSAPLPINAPRPDEPSPDQVERAVSVLRSAINPVVLAGCVSPRRSGCRWPPPSTARGSSPTTTPRPWERSVSCATTMSTSASTART